MDAGLLDLYNRLELLDKAVNVRDNLRSHFDRNGDLGSDTAEAWEAILNTFVRALFFSSIADNDAIAASLSSRVQVMVESDDTEAYAEETADAEAINALGDPTVKKVNSA